MKATWCIALSLLLFCDLGFPQLCPLLLKELAHGPIPDMKQASLEQRLAAAENVLGRKLSPMERTAVVNSYHLNYLIEGKMTMPHYYDEKYRSYVYEPYLVEVGFSKDEIAHLNKHRLFDADPGKKIDYDFRSALYQMSREEIGEVMQITEMGSSPSEPEKRKLLNQALSKIPTYSGTVHRVSKTWDTLENIRKRYKVGEKVTEELFLHTSKRKDWFTEYKRFPIRFTIESKTGRDLRWFNSNRTEEEEVLFSSDTSFQVLSYSEKDGYINIHLSESSGP